MCCAMLYEIIDVLRYFFYLIHFYKANFLFPYSLVGNGASMQGSSTVIENFWVSIRHRFFLLNNVLLRQQIFK
jgi:hypothetical protein